MRELLDRGEQVRALILPGEDTTSLEGLPVERVEGNVLDLDSLRTAMQGVDVVFHLAALVSITEDKANLVHQVNVEGTRNVIEAAKEAKIKKLVYTSSIHALERPRRSEVGELILSFMQNKLTFLVEGAYDFVDVRDVAKGQILARDHAKSGETYILGGERTELKVLHNLVKRATGKDTKIFSFPLPVALIVAPIAELYYRVTKTRPRFTRYSIETVISNSDIYSDKAKSELGYRPRALVDSIRDTVRWWWDNLGLTKRSLRL